MCTKCNSALASILPPSSSSLPHLIGLGHLVMCGAYTATIPPGSRLSVYRFLAGVYYTQGRCQRGGGGGGDVKDKERVGCKKNLDSSLLWATTTTPLEWLFNNVTLVSLIIPELQFMRTVLIAKHLWLTLLNSPWTRIKLSFSLLSVSFFVLQTKFPIYNSVIPYQAVSSHWPSFHWSMITTGYI